MRYYFEFMNPDKSIVSKRFDADSMDSAWTEAEIYSKDNKFIDFRCISTDDKLYKSVNEAYGWADDYWHDITIREEMQDKFFSWVKSNDARLQAAYDWYCNIDKEALEYLVTDFLDETFVPIEYYTTFEGKNEFGVRDKATNELLFHSESKDAVDDYIDEHIKSWDNAQYDACYDAAKKAINTFGYYYFQVEDEYADGQPVIEEAVEIEPELSKFDKLKALMYTVEKYLYDNHIYTDFETFSDTSNYIMFSVNMGDWRHEHLSLKNAVWEYLFDNGIEVIDMYSNEEDNGSDTYDAEHYFVIDTDTIPYDLIEAEYKKGSEYKSKQIVEESTYNEPYDYDDIDSDFDEYGSIRYNLEDTGDGKYYVVGYFDNKRMGIDDNLMTDDIDEAMDKAWELTCAGDYVEIKNMITGDKEYMDIDEVDDDGGEYVAYKFRLIESKQLKESPGVSETFIYNFLEAWGGLEEPEKVVAYYDYNNNQYIIDLAELITWRDFKTLEKFFRNYFKRSWEYDLYPITDSDEGVTRIGIASGLTPEDEESLLMDESLKLKESFDLKSSIKDFYTKVRERIFEKLSELLNVDYDEIYNLCLGESVKVTEDTIKKSNGKWTNRGDDGEEHGEFKTKKEADKQRKAMYANGYTGESAKITEAVNNDIEFSAYITNLDKYNEGELVGKWVKFPIDEDDFEEVLKSIGIGDTDDFGAPYEEWFVTDYECNLDGFRWEDLGEYPSYESLQEFGELLESVDDNEAVSNAYEVTGNLKEAIEGIENGDLIYYPGINSDSELGEYIISEIYGDDIPDDLVKEYFDYEALGRDLSFDEYENDEGEMVSAGEYWFGDENASNQEIGEEYVAEVGIEGVVNKEYYFDYETFGRDLTLGGFTFTSDGCIERR